MYVIAFLAGDRPYVSPLANKQEIVGEMIVLIATYPLLTFTDFVWDLNTRDLNGLIIVGCILLNIVGNIIVVTVIAIHQMIYKCRYYFIR